MFRPVVLIPTFDNPATVSRVVQEVRKHIDAVLVIDDGSGQEGRSAVERLAEEGLAEVRRRAENGGKGAAVKTGFAAAHELGFTHAIQVDADGQHDVSDLPRFLAAGKQSPEALVLGSPVFDRTQPWGRAFGRKISQFWVNVETGGQVIDDPQCGFRVYPIGAALRARARGNRMQFDQELPVRMIWNGVPVVNLPTKVRYLSEEEGGVSHFQMFRDNVRISAMHCRLFFSVLGRRLLGRNPYRVEPRP